MHPPPRWRPQPAMAPRGGGWKRWCPPTAAGEPCRNIHLEQVLCCTHGQSCCMLSRVGGTGCRVQRSLVRSGCAADCRTRPPLAARGLQTAVRAAAGSMQQQPPEAVPQAEAAWEWFNSMGAPKYWVRRAGSTALLPAGHRLGLAGVALPLAAGRRLQRLCAGLCRLLAPRPRMHAAPSSPHGCCCLGCSFSLRWPPWLTRASLRSGSCAGGTAPRPPIHPCCMLASFWRPPPIAQSTSPPRPRWVPACSGGRTIREPAAAQAAAH